MYKMALSAACLDLSNFALRELRIHLCQYSPQSQGVRTFLQQNYVGIKCAYPHMPILIRECRDAPAVVWARYYKGTEFCASLGGLTPQEVQKAIQQICTKSVNIEME